MDEEFDISFERQTVYFCWSIRGTVNQQSDRHGLSRRQLLLGTASAGLTATSAGCVRRARSILGRAQPGQVSLSITCVPAEEEPYPVEIVSHFRDHLETAGIDTTVNYRSNEEFRLDVLLNHDYDIAVGRLPVYPDPDALYGLFHSSLGPERGWQNPYGFSTVDLDEELELQRGETQFRRYEHVDRILEILAREQPIAPLVFPIEHRLVRADRYDGFEGREFKDAADVLALDPGERRESLEFTIGFTAPTKNLNPLSVEHRTEELVTGLVYDSLLRRGGEQYHSWLAESVNWSNRSAIVTLRDAEWHDGEPVTSDDVVFTYRLLQDTLQNEGTSPAPAPVFRGRTSLVKDIVARTDRTIGFEFDGRQNVARRAFTVPILPRHEWEERTETAEVSGIDSNPQITEATVTDNIPPVGSGPYEFVDHSVRNYVELELVDDHFSTQSEALSEFAPPAEEVRVVVAPADAGAVDGIQNGRFDFTKSPIPPKDIDVELNEEISVTKTRSRNLYHVGYNTRRDPLSNTSFRRAISSLLDKSWLATEVFDGQAAPTATPILNQEWVPERLRWFGTDPEVPFLGEDGVLDVPAVKETLLDIGYQYDENENLLGT